MPSIFSYYRPRGIRGNYIVAILLDLLESETATVSVARTRGTNCGHCGVQKPNIEQRSVSPARTMNERHARRWELYRIDQMIVGDSITIQVRDKDVIPHQETVYAAWPDKHSFSNKTVTTQDGFTEQEKAFDINGKIWPASELKLNPIKLIDWDKSSNTFGEEGHRVSMLLGLEKPEAASKHMRASDGLVGEVIQIEPDIVLVLVDNGTRFVGLLPITELLMSGVHVGDKITVYVRKPETHNSFVLLSTKPVPSVIEQAEVVAADAASKLEKPELRTIALDEYGCAVNGEDAPSNGHQVRYYSNDPPSAGMRNISPHKERVDRAI